MLGNVETVRKNIFVLFICVISVFFAVLKMKGIMVIGDKTRSFVELDCLVVISIYPD